MLAMMLARALYNMVGARRRARPGLRKNHIGTTATRELHMTNVPETRSSRELADLNFPETRPLRVSFFGNAFRNTKWPLRHIAEVPTENL